MPVGLVIVIAVVSAILGASFGILLFAACSVGGRNDAHLDE